MSCLYPAWLQICTYLAEPHKIALLQHPVFREYAKIVFSPDFSYTFPTFIFIFAIYIALQKNLNLKWIETPIIMKLFSMLIRIVVIWNVINAALWCWLVMQSALYCIIWTYWNNKSEFSQIHYPWWKKVFASFDPPPSEPLLSASFISWTLSMIISVICVYVANYTDYIIAIVRKVFRALKRNLKITRKWQKSLSKNLENQQFCHKTKDISTEEISVATNCSDCGLGLLINSEIPHVNHRGISPICYGTNWILPPNNKLKNVKRSTV